jgi:hypothetical protein
MLRELLNETAVCYSINKLIKSVGEREKTTTAAA